jgi:hypothetical protein
MEHYKGFYASVFGKRYEDSVHQVVNKCQTESGRLFNTQSKDELGGCSMRNDLECNFAQPRDTPIEVKKKNSPDWMQVTLVFDKESKKWKTNPKCKINQEARNIFESIIQKYNIFGGQEPSFLKSNITHEQWVQLKTSSNTFSDEYLECPDDTIARLYRSKGCKYVQISEKGLYHVGDDIHQFGVPMLICKQVIRIRTKVHSRVNRNGFCHLSVTASCRPENVRDLPNSRFSLDDRNSLPGRIVYAF